MQVNLTAMQQQRPELARMAREMDNYFVKELLYRRNEIMAERIIKLLKDNPDKSFFFAFGAGNTSLQWLPRRGIID